MKDKIREAIRKKEPVGIFIRQEMIDQTEETLKEIADQIETHWTSISYVMSGRNKLSPKMAAKLSHHFNTYTTAQLLSVQSAYDADQADQAYATSLVKKGHHPT
ncbi:MAG: hypothetical protein DHS20C02_06760 [Micavibrio sp.]|nr:MAG: hypothetical protein DHS20C02_06760 [Micavibrio sp.]